MLAGIVIQLGWPQIHLSSWPEYHSDFYFPLAAITLYSALGFEFFYRYHTDRPIRKSVDAVRRDFDRRLQLMVFGLILSTLCLFIR